MDRKYAEYATNKAVQLLAIDSPTGFTDKAAEWVKNEFSTLGFDAKITAKGGVLVDLGGENDSDALFLEAHTDTLGGMVAEVKGSGRLKLTNLGGIEQRTRKPKTSEFTQGTARFTKALSSSAMLPYTSTAATETQSAAGLQPKSCLTKT